MTTQHNLFPTMFAAAVLVLGLPAVHAQNTGCYTAASVQGTWALVTNYNENMARAFGHRTINANGNMTGTFVLDGPPTGSTDDEVLARTTGTQVGVYAINCDGTGTITRTVTASTGITANQVDDLLITQATVQNGQLIATALIDVEEPPSALISGGAFVVRAHTRLPDVGAGCFTLGSLQGSYGVVV